MRAVLAASIVLLAPMAASAGAVSYSSDQVIEHFAASAALGPARGICIGTAEECSNAPAQAPVPTPAAASPFDLMVTFELNSDRLSALAMANLAEFAKALSDPRLGKAHFSVEGHTDATGPETYNQNLSERRAGAVVSFLSELGVDPSRFVIRGFGAAFPRSNNPFDPVNRRVETRLIP